MPTAPPRHCPRCGAAVAHGRRCSCRPAWTGKSDNSTRRRGSTRRSRKQRAAMLAAHPLCARRGDEWWWPGPARPCRELATQDDHVVPLSRGGDLHDRGNRQGLCEDCHAVKTRAEAAAGRRC